MMSWGGDDARQARIATLARLHGDELQGFLVRQTRSAEQAADLRQDVFLRLLGTDPETIADWRAYLYRVARNLVSDTRRRQRLEHRIFDADAANENLVAPEASAETVVADKEELARLRLALADLTPHLRQALLWYRLDGLTLKQIGAKLGVSESMASRYVAEALKHCQARLGRPAR